MLLWREPQTFSTTLERTPNSLCSHGENPKPPVQPWGESQSPSATVLGSRGSGDRRGVALCPLTAGRVVVQHGHPHPAEAARGWNLQLGFSWTRVRMSEDE